MTFQVNATTDWGQNIHVAGGCDALGGWETGRAPELDPANYPVWKLSLDMPAGTRCAYKYLRKDGSGDVQWESGANRSFTVPDKGAVKLGDDWRD